jgi:hypothetical protein
MALALESAGLRRRAVGYRLEYEDLLAETRAALDKEAFEAARAEGRAMDLDEAVAYALES